MLAGWAAEGVGTGQVLRLPGKLPGIYMIETDDKGERRFFHWRESSAARSLMDLPGNRQAFLESLASYDLVYLSAITLSLYSDERAGAADRGACDTRAKAAHALRSTPIFASAAGPISISRAPSIARPSRHPISCWPRRRICCRSMPGKATMV